MGAIGGLDVAYGASAQIIQTNVLLVDNTGEPATTKEMARFLTLFNTQCLNKHVDGLGLSVTTSCQIRMLQAMRLLLA